LVNAVGRKFKVLTQADFIWNNANKYFDTNTAVIDKSLVISISVIPTNGVAIMGCYVRTNNTLAVSGIQPTGVPIASDYTFNVYIEYK
jgi:hypothetical protein